MGLHNCQSLGPAYFCRNTQGSFRCDQRQCSRGETLDIISGKCQKVDCEIGFEPGPSGQCIDIDECETNNPCNPYSEECRNTLGSFECLTVCAKVIFREPNFTYLIIKEIELSKKKIFFIGITVE